VRVCAGNDPQRPTMRSFSELHAFSPSNTRL
jgi:hypothetical protein